MVLRSPLAWFAPLALALAVSPFATAAVAGEPEACAAQAEDEDAPTDVASVKIELKQANGKTLKYDGALLDWGADGNVTFKVDDHVHDVSLRIDRTNDTAKTIALTVGYTKDGRSVIEPQTVDSEILKREVIRIDGGAAIAITVSAKVNKPQPAPEEPTPEEPVEEPKEKPKTKRIVDGGGDDPLDGIK